MNMAKVRRRKPVSRIAVGYVRMSTDKQDLSPLVQHAAISAWCKSEGYELVQVYEDLATSGGAEIADRPGLAGALSSLRSHQATALIAAKRDRFARDVAIAGEVERLAYKAGCRTFAADGMGNGEDDGAAFLRDISACMSAHERRLIRRRTRDALALKRARGERAGCIPYGQRLGKDGVHLMPDPAEQAVIARAKALSDEGLSVRAIAAALESEGVLGRTGAPLGHVQVHRLLRPLLLAEAA